MIAVTIIKKRPFWDYVGRREDFLKLPKSDKEKIFLRWKHGGQNHDTNYEGEMTDKYLLERLTYKDIDAMAEDKKTYWKMEKDFYEKCQNIKREIGLIAPVTIDPAGVAWND